MQPRNRILAPMDDVGDLVVFSIFSLGVRWWSFCFFWNLFFIYHGSYWCLVHVCLSLIWWFRICTALFIRLGFYFPLLYFTLQFFSLSDPPDFLFYSQFQFTDWVGGEKLCFRSGAALVYNWIFSVVESSSLATPRIQTLKFSTVRVNDYQPNAFAKRVSAYERCAVITKFHAWKWGSFRSHTPENVSLLLRECFLYSPRLSALSRTFDNKNMLCPTHRHSIPMKERRRTVRYTMVLFPSCLRLPNLVKNFAGAVFLFYSIMD